MPVVWDAAADRKLFLAILKDQNVKVDSKSVSAALASDGLQVTSRAVEERLKKLKKMANENNGPTGDGTGEDPPAARPKAIPRSRRKNAAVDEDEDDGDGDGPSPFKKARKPSLKKPKTKKDMPALPTEDDEALGEGDEEMFPGVKVEASDEY